MKCHTNIWLFKDKKVIQPGKVLSFGKKPEISSRARLFGVGEKFASLMQGFPNSGKRWDKANSPQKGGENRKFY